MSDDRVARARILILDDDRRALRTLARQLEREGRVCASEGRSGREGLTTMKAWAATAVCWGRLEGTPAAGAAVVAWPPCSPNTPEPAR
jgi:ActR/RegA family two-component response regulator